MKIITLANQKGGVGKTTLSLSMGFAAADANKRVLFIELDPQCNLSKTLVPNLVPRPEHDTLGTSDYFFYEEKCPQVKIQEVPPMFDMYYEGQLFVVPAHGLRLADAANQNSKSLMETVKRIGSFLEENKDKFDVVIIDTPPSLGGAQFIALMVSESVVCPIEMDEYSSDGLAAMLTLLKKIKGVNKKLRIAGIVANRLAGSSRTKLDRLAKLRAELGEFVLPQPIKTADAISEAMVQRRPTWKKAPSGSAADAGRKLLATCKDLLVRSGVEGI